jgi:hypothetical protein
MPSRGESWATEGAPGVVVAVEPGERALALA